MWFTNITKDIGDITSSFVEDTRNFANLVTRLAAEVTGGDVLTAGDEESLLAEQCPLDEADIVSFQRNNLVFIDDICEDEKVSFEVWVKESEYASQSSFQPRKEGLVEASDGRCEKLVISRQRLLDNSSPVRRRYAAFVLNDGQKKQLTGERDALLGESGEGSVTEDQAGDDEVTPLDESLRITEDMFFDRYFFRLSQLRVRTAAERKQRQEASGKKAFEERRSDESAKTVLKSFTQRLVEAADSLISWDDGKQEPSGESRHLQGAREDNECTVAALRSVAQALQKELWLEKRRLAAVLETARSCGLSEEQQRLLHEAARKEEQGDESTAKLPVAELQSGEVSRRSTSVREELEDGKGEGNGSENGDKGGKSGKGLPGGQGCGETNDDVANVEFSVDQDGWTKVKYEEV